VTDGRVADRRTVGVARCTTVTPPVNRILSPHDPFSNQCLSFFALHFSSITVLRWT